MRREYDVIVVGGGITGAFIAHHLSRIGVGLVHLIEKRGIASGASDHRAANVRLFHRNSRVVELALESLRFFQKLSAVERKLIDWTPRGAVHFLSRNGKIWGQTLCTMHHSSNWPLVYLAAEQGRDLFPYFTWKTEDAAVYEPLSMCVSPQNLTRLILEQSLGDTTSYETGTHVLALREETHTPIVEVHTTNGTYRARYVVVATAAGTATLLPNSLVEPRPIQMADIELPPSVETLPFFVDGETRLFGRCNGDGTASVGHGLPDSAAVISDIDEDEAHTSLELAVGRIPAWVGASITKVRRTVDGFRKDPVLDFPRVRDLRRVVVAAGFGGTGVKIAPAVASRVAGFVSLGAQYG